MCCARRPRVLVNDFLALSCKIDLQRRGARKKTYQTRLVFDETMILRKVGGERFADQVDLCSTGFHGSDRWLMR